MSTNRIFEWVAAGTAFLLPLAFWPPSPQPFSSAKEWLLAIWVLSGMAIAVSGRWPHNRIPLKALLAVMLWIMAISLSAGTGEESSVQELVRNLLPCAGYLLLIWSEVRPEKLVYALVWSATLVSAIALLQFADLDPFRLLNLTSSIQGGSRIRIFSTMGNPNFVAAFLTAALPLTVFGTDRHAGISSLWPRLIRTAQIVLQVAAIAATGSRAPILGLITGGVWLLLRKVRIRKSHILAALVLCGFLILISPARPLYRTISGRLYIWRTAALHFCEIPIAGFGPGAFSLRFAEWETEFLRKNPENPVQSFAGLQDHAHNDYLEYFVDFGFIGLAALVGVVALSAPLWRRPPLKPLETALSASFFSLMGIAMVDFPLHRPTELYLFWTQLALLWIVGRGSSMQENRQVLS